jgi:hypothetical protein
MWLKRTVETICARTAGQCRRGARTVEIKRRASRIRMAGAAPSEVGEAVSAQAQLCCAGAKRIGHTHLDHGFDP